MNVGKRRLDLGFTLIELLVTIAVAIILATIAVPGFQGMMERNQLASDYNEILSGLYLSRSEAIKRREDVTFSSAGGSYSVSTDGATLRSRNTLASTVTVDKVDVDGNIEVKFNSLGRIVESSACDGGCTLTISYSNAGSKTIDISGFGRVGRGDP